MAILIRSALAPLDGHIDRFTFERLTLGICQREHIGQEAFTSEERIDVSLPPSLVQRAIPRSP